MNQQSQDEFQKEIIEKTFLISALENSPLSKEKEKPLRWSPMSRTVFQFISMVSEIPGKIYTKINTLFGILFIVLKLFKKS